MDRLMSMNPRERRLLAVTLAIVVVAGGFLGIQSALAALRRLDDQIAQLELELENLKQQHIQRGVVEAAYSALVTEHSSQLTAEQIHDNLRREIYSLAQFPRPATDDQPARVVQLVSIPTLEMGQLTQGEGHREYRIQFEIPVAGLNSLIFFLQRIESSDQLLRIDRLEIGRAPGSQLVHANVEITRTVLDDPQSVAAGAPT